LNTGALVMVVQEQVPMLQQVVKVLLRVSKVAILVQPRLQLQMPRQFLFIRKLAEPFHLPAD